MDQAEVVRDYKALRRAGVQLNSRLAEMLDKEEIHAAARALGMLQGQTIVMETEDDVGVMMEYGIHNVFRGGRNAVDRMLEENPPSEGSLELRLLRSMQQSHYTLFEAREPIPGLGVRGMDGPERTPLVIVDLGFSQTGVAGLLLATRIYSPGEGWWMTTGAALPVNKQALNRIIREVKGHQRRFAVEPSEQERTTMIIRACVASGASREISYADVGQSITHSGAALMIAGPPKIGRNDPCPCGSGRKYKKCCGSG